DRNSLKTALDIAFAEDSRVIVEELVTAHEVECAVMGNRELFAPTTGEIVTTDGFYDYESKYVNDSAKLMMPATVSAESNEEVKALAKKVYKVLGCKGLSRVDFFVEDGGRVLFNEINTLPGFTSISMYPKMMMYSGMSYAEIITRLIQLALEK
ncbi:MAG: ATP-grasp domain-containing protein, partial [Oscillospiraceae bacterium]|nr:ATP-grasp domain-containing protein [Oscillospiraceae bacterium]